MIKVKPHQKQSLLKGIKKPSSSDERHNEHLVVSFKYLDNKQGQTFEDWEKDHILAESLNTLAGYCHDTLQNQCHTASFKPYKNFPSKENTEYDFPDHVPQDACWASMHINGKQCLVGHIFSNVFYVVFLDKHHRFWISKKKHT